MVLIPEGSFLYGEKKEQIRLPAYYIDLYPVTNEQFMQFIDDTGYLPEEDADLLNHWDEGIYPAGREDHPVTWVNWHDAMAYARWAGKRLPTNEEWEKAARGADGREYPWGDEFDPRRCNSEESGPENTTPVTRYSMGVSPFGCYDMAGNVWEWTASSHTDEEGQSYQILRGGAWSPFDYASTFTFLIPYRFAPIERLDVFGFRCAKDVEG